MADKALFVHKVRDAATKLAQVTNEMDDLLSVWFDRGYASGGSSSITDADLQSIFGASTTLTAAQVAGLVTLAENLNKFLNSLPGAVTADYDVTLNQLRTDA